MEEIIKNYTRTILRKVGLLKLVRQLKTKINILRGKVYNVSVKLVIPKVYLGSDHAGWTICPTNLNQNSIVYSFGLGVDISFDLDIIKNYQCRVFESDPTPKSIEFLENQKLPELFKYYDYAISNYDGKLELFFQKMKKMFH
jgi:hypothetical protein